MGGAPALVPLSSRFLLSTIAILLILAWKVAGVLRSGPVPAPRTRHALEAGKSLHPQPGLGSDLVRTRSGTVEEGRHQPGAPLAVSGRLGETKCREWKSVRVATRRRNAYDAGVA